MEQQGLLEPPVAEEASEPEPVAAPVPEDEGERQEAPWSAHRPEPEGHPEQSPSAQGPEDEQEVPVAREAQEEASVAR